MSDRMPERNKKEKINELCVLVLGVMEKGEKGEDDDKKDEDNDMEAEDDDKDKDGENEKESTCPMAVRTKGKK